MKSCSDIIDALGGYRPVAEALGVPEGTVASWKCRGRISSNAWPGILNLAKAEGVDWITIDALHNLRIAKQKEPEVAK
tara:strand:- start:3632 stop:3865 length:234 start_codon:yes stop_codon:yes gene_type:complete